jgi:hypothetical protein
MSLRDFLLLHSHAACSEETDIPNIFWPKSLLPFEQLPEIARFIWWRRASLSK